MYPMKKRRIGIGVLIVVAGILFAAPLCAEQKDVIVIGGDHNPPFRLVEGGTYSGIFGEMIHEIVRGMNLEVRFQECPFKRCLAELRDGDIDVFLALLKRPEREDYLYYAKPYIKGRTDRAFYLRKGEGSRIQKYEDLYGLEIGLLRGVKITERFDNDPNLNTHGTTTHEQNFLKLIAGRIDTFVHTEIAIDYQLKLLGYYDRIEKAPLKFTKFQPTYFVISKQSKYMDRIPDFEANLQRLAEENTFWELVDKWTQ